MAKLYRDSEWSSPLIIPKLIDQLLIVKVSARISESATTIHWMMNHYGGNECTYNTSLVPTNKGSTKITLITSDEFLGINLGVTSKYWRELPLRKWINSSVTYKDYKDYLNRLPNRKWEIVVPNLIKYGIAKRRYINGLPATGEIGMKIGMLEDESSNYSTPFIIH